MPTRRWDDDVVGRGVGSAAGATPDLRRLLDASAAPDWVAEQPDVHLLPAVREALDPDQPLRLASTRVDPDGSLALDLAWQSTEEPSPRTVRAAVYRLLGSVAEISTHVQEHPGAEFTVVTGILDGDSAWRGHGHLLRLRVSSRGG